MILKKSLRIKHELLTGQAALEYILIFAAIGVLGLISVSTFLPIVRDAAQGSATQAGYFRRVTNKIIKADLKYP